MALRWRGLDVTNPINRLAAGFATLAVNVRAYLSGGFMLRNPLSIAMFASLPAPIHTIRRLNDSTPNGPPGGYTLIIGAGTILYAWNPTIGLVTCATGLTGNPLSMVPFRPNTSVQPWMYVFDSAIQGAVTLMTKYLISGASVNFVSNGLMKVRSDGLCYKTGIKEPQLAPVVSTANSSVVTTGTLLATAIPWTNYTGANPGYNYGETNGFPDPTPDGTAPFVINVRDASFITITSLTGSATINGGAATPTTLGPSPAAATNPGHFVMAKGTGATPPATATVVIGAFTDGAGNVIPAGVAPLFFPSVWDVGAVIGVSEAIEVPSGAVAFQIGINSTGNTFHLNSGSFALSVTVTTNALPTVTSILGTLNLAYWGDSPMSGAVGSYVWKNPDDPAGSGPTRSISNAIGTTTGNSFIFDATFTAGIPALPGVGTQTLPMEWTALTPESVAIGETPVFPSPITTPYTGNTFYNNFNFVMYGSIYIPAPGQYTFVLTSHDDVIWGIEDATVVSASAVRQGAVSVPTGLAEIGQTITVVKGYPLLPRGNQVGGGNSGENGDFVTSTVVLSFAAAGIYGIELDFDYWFHDGRILLLQASPTPGAGAFIIPPLPASVRQEVQYRYVYRSSATGAPSNPSPESTAEAIPVAANTITSLWSPDPQVDVVDYYRIDSVTADFTYVATGPNDDSGGGTNTPISDSLTDAELGTQLLDEDNFEPFPVLDLPQKGICNVSGGVITWVSGGAIGGTATGFNLRWLAGTEILIGSPTSLAYTFIARPTSTTTVTIPDVPDGTNLVYEIEEPLLANQPLPYVWGPSDNIPFACATGDQINQGKMYWCKGNNLDAAPDTNQLDLSDPSESVVNGCYTGGKGLVFTIKRAIAVLPNFFNAQATATGTVGSTWSVRTTGITRGLFIPRCLCVSGGGNVYFRVDDGIHISPGGGASQSITDETLYPLFSHGGSTPTAIVRNGITIYPPDDTLPQLQRLSYDNGYCFWDFQGIDGNPHTLVFDEAAMGWVWDITTPAATIHAPNEGEATQGFLVGCHDGSLRQFSSTGTETVTGTVVTPAVGGKGFLHYYEVTVEYSSSAAVTFTPVAADADNGSYVGASTTLPSTGGEPTKYTFTMEANKFQWVQFLFQSTDPDLQVFLEGFAVEVSDWGSGAYRTVRPFAPSGGEGVAA